MGVIGMQRLNVQMVDVKNKKLVSPISILSLIKNKG